MRISATYKLRLGKGIDKPFADTIALYRRAVAFFVDMIIDRWDSDFEPCGNGKDAVRKSESLSLSTLKNPNPVFDFSSEFPKFPCYLRRAAIVEAFGMVSSYMSNLKNWEESDKNGRGKAPSKPEVGNSCPAMYKGNCYTRTGAYTAKIKVWVRNTWDWVDVTLRKTDADYISRRCSSWKECSPTLRKRGKNWSLDFSFEKSVTLNTTPVEERRIVAVDLGINSAATCCVMEHDGTVTARRFLSMRREYDCLYRALDRIKAAQRSGARRMPKLWAVANNINRGIAEKTARFIQDLCVLYDADVVVMESLDLKGRKKGPKKQQLHHWRAKYVQELVERKCHADGNRFATVCAWNTSRLAFDGSGFVKRGSESGLTFGSYSVCEFRTGKVYNCDLNASYNIGARYFIREILGSMPERARCEAEAKVPALRKRSTCTLSDLKGLRAVMEGSCLPSAERVMSGKARDSRAPQGQPRCLRQRDARDFSRSRLHMIDNAF